MSLWLCPFTPDIYLIHLFSFLRKRSVGILFHDFLPWVPKGINIYGYLIPIVCSTHRELVSLSFLGMVSCYFDHTINQCSEEVQQNDRKWCWFHFIRNSKWTKRFPKDGKRLWISKRVKTKRTNKTKKSFFDKENYFFQDRCFQLWRQRISHCELPLWHIRACVWAGFGCFRIWINCSGPQESHI